MGMARGALQTFNNALDATTGFVDATRLLTGREPNTGERLSGGQLAIAGGMFALSVIPSLKGDVTAARLGTRMVHGGVVDADFALSKAQHWLGEGYREIDNGVFRSADNARQFRMTDADLLHPNGMHVHFEAIGKDGKEILENSHVYIQGN